jgi:hypothetical protein
MIGVMVQRSWKVCGHRPATGWRLKYSENRGEECRGIEAREELQLT